MPVVLISAVADDMKMTLPDAATERLGPLSVLVVGGGIGGLAAAIALRQNGHHVSVRPPTPARESDPVPLRLTPIHF